jgi:hypothetical protein
MALVTCAVSRHDRYLVNIRTVPPKRHARLPISFWETGISLALRGGTDEDDVNFENNSRHLSLDPTAGGVFLASKEDDIPESKGYKRGRDEMTTGVDEDYSPERWDLPQWTKGSD